MSVNSYIQNFVESKIKSDAVLKKFLAAPEATRLHIYYEGTPENPNYPYLLLRMESPEEYGRSLQMEISAYACTALVNIIGTSLEQVRLLADRITEIFDAQIKFADFEHIEDCTCTQPDELKYFDKDTKAPFWETAQRIKFNYVL